LWPETGTRGLNGPPGGLIDPLGCWRCKTQGGWKFRRGCM